MKFITEMVGAINGVVWGVPMLILILGAGLFLTVGLRFLTIMNIPFGFSLLWKGRIPGNDAGDITPFNALMTSLSATIGTGNIAGVAGAIAVGGPGAVFWMWIIAIFGIATKYAEAVLAVQFRETDVEGNHVGGPMYYIRNGLGQNWSWMAEARERLARSIRGASAMVSGQGASGDKTIICRVSTQWHMNIKCQRC